MVVEKSQSPLTSIFTINMDEFNSSIRKQRYSHSFKNKIQLNVLKRNTNQQNYAKNKIKKLNKITQKN